MEGPIIVDFTEPKSEIMVESDDYRNDLYGGLQVDLSSNYSVQSKKSGGGGHSDLAKAGCAHIFNQITGPIHDLRNGPPNLDNVRRLIDNPTYTDNSLINSGVNAYGASTKANPALVKSGRLHARKESAALKLHINDYNVPYKLLRKDQRLLGRGMDRDGTTKF